MRIGYNTWSMATVPYGEFIPELAAIGYTSLAISVVPAYGIAGRRVPNAASLDALSAEDRRRIKEGCAERGLELAAVVGNQPIIEPDAERSRDALARLRETIDFCVEVAPPGQPLPTMNTGSGGRPADFEAGKGQLVERLGGLAEHARARGVTIAVEPHVGAAIDTPERSEWLVRTVGHPNVRLDFDVSHFEVVGIPAAESVARLVPLSASVEIKDQNFRYTAGAAEPPPGWRVEGNGVGRAVAPDGREVEYQFLLGGEGDFDLPEYLRLMRAAGWTGGIGFEASVQCQGRPGYDALREAQRTFAWMRAGWERAGVPTD